MSLEFGVFDHLDRNDLPLRDYYEQRLKVIEAFDRGGFYAYHVAEHHFTPLGMAPSPSVFLAAVAQRTRTLRFGPLVYTVNLYHPLRLIDEICMLDQLSGGRLELGIGRGISPYEVGYYGVDPETGPERFAEALEVILKGLTQPRLDHHGKYFTFKDVPMEMTPVQRPYPPLWYGANSLDSAENSAGSTTSSDSSAMRRSTRFARSALYCGTCTRICDWPSDKSRKAASPSALALNLTIPSASTQR